MLYHKTNSILYVMQKLGHKNIRNTLKYTQILTNEDADNYICKVAENVEQSKKLIEIGFDYIMEQDGLKLFRKRK